MKNVDRIAKHVTKNGTKGILIHTIPGSSAWLVCQKIDENTWSITLGDPMGNVTYNLGIVSDAQHLVLWNALTKKQIENNESNFKKAKELKQFVFNFLKSYEGKTFKKFTKLEDKEAEKRTQLRNKHRGSKKPSR